MSVKICKVKLQNIRCFKEAELSFEDDKQNSKNWTLLIGNNGQGKTTFLRSIAMGLCPAGEASGLLAELHNGILRSGEKKGLIEIELKDPNKTYKIRNELELKGSEEVLKQTVEGGDRKDFENALFVVAYGSGRSIEGTESYLEYAIVDSVYGLFNSTYTLQNAELSARRLSTDEKGEEKLFELLKKVLRLEDNDRIVLKTNGLFIKSIWGEIPFQALSDGYKSVTTTILDFLSWKQLQEKQGMKEDISGIFILDEVEQHLHPSWQREIIKILSKIFPKVQFIGATHAPICALGSADVESTQIAKTSYVNGYSEIEPFDLLKDYKGYRVDQILTSQLFDLKSSRNIETQQKLDEYADLYLKEKLSNEDDKRKKELQKELKKLPLWETERDKLVLEKLSKSLGSQN